MTHDRINVDWQGIVSDNTGKYLTAVTDESGIYTSSDYGVNWIQSSAPTKFEWRGITSDSTGGYLAAVVGNGGGIYTSSDYGVHWVQTTATSDYWPDQTTVQSNTQPASGLSNATVITEITSKDSEEMNISK